MGEVKAMRTVKIPDTPPADWIAEADEITKKLLAAQTAEERKQIISENEGLWRDPRIHQWLLDKFHNKCWYSEAFDSVSPDHVDHFRPKGRIKQALGAEPEDGYWWLAFDWKNYRISGHLLNTKKGDLFPICRGIRCQPGDEGSLELEENTLIDPISDDACLISFDIDEDGCRAVKTNGCSAEEEERVEKTIEILGLNIRDKLNQKRKLTWDKAAEYIAEFESAQKSTSVRALAAVQKKIARKHLQEMIGYNAEFSSVAHACIEKNAPETLRKLVFEA
ncbi:MAG: hypothetical protein G8D88_21520 [gamma proteobacterium symbiont of Ctena orbiculata]